MIQITYQHDHIQRIQLYTSIEEAERGIDQTAKRTQWKELPISAVRILDVDANDVSVEEELELVPNPSFSLIETDPKLAVEESRLFSLHEIVPVPSDKKVSL